MALRAPKHPAKYSCGRTPSLKLCRTGNGTRRPAESSYRESPALSDFTLSHFPFAPLATCIAKAFFDSSPSSLTASVRSPECSSAVFVSRSSRCLGGSRPSARIARTAVRNCSRIACVRGPGSMSSGAGLYPPVSYPARFATSESFFIDSRYVLPEGSWAARAAARARRPLASRTPTAPRSSGGTASSSRRRPIVDWVGMAGYP
jgi:hypothetical protein